MIEARRFPADTDTCAAITGCRKLRTNFQRTSQSSAGAQSQFVPPSYRPQNKFDHEARRILSRPLHHVRFPKPKDSPKKTALTAAANIADSPQSRVSGAFLFSGFFLFFYFFFSLFFFFFFFCLSVILTTTGARSGQGRGDEAWEWAHRSEVARDRLQSISASRSSTTTSYAVCWGTVCLMGGRTKFG